MSNPLIVKFIVFGLVPRLDQVQIKVEKAVVICDMVRTGLF